MKTFHYAWNGRNKFIDAHTREEADAAFMARFGFFPEDTSVTVYTEED